MKEKFGFWLLLGIGSGILLGVAMKNFSAGIGLGSITGFLLALVQTNYANK